MPEAEGYVLMAGNLEHFKGFDLLAAAIDLHRQRGGRMKYISLAVSGRLTLIQQ